MRAAGVTARPSWLRKPSSRASYFTEISSVFIARTASTLQALQKSHCSFTKSEAACMGSHSFMVICSLANLIRSPHVADLPSNLQIQRHQFSEAVVVLVHVHVLVDVFVVTVEVLLVVTVTVDVLLVIVVVVAVVDVWVAVVVEGQPSGGWCRQHQAFQSGVHTVSHSSAPTSQL